MAQRAAHQRGLKKIARITPLAHLCYNGTMLLTDVLLQEAVQRLVDVFAPEQIILFGSHAWGTPTADSDLDLLVIVAESALSDYERAVQGHRALTGFPMAKDIVVKTRAEFDFLGGVRASLEYKIAHQGIVLYDHRQNAIGSKLAYQSAT